MTLYFITSAVLASFILVVVLVNIIFGPVMQKAPEIIDEPSVSLLVPARDEEQNISNCLAGLLNQNYSNFEILVLDDHSTDRTAEIVKTFSNKSDKITLLRSEPLPEGWNGKNWACHQLGERATGHYLIFTDADVRHHPNALQYTLGWMQEYQLGMFTAFPQQITETFGEKLLVPLMEVILYSALPLWLICKSKMPSLSAANGQWIAFSKDAYLALGGHRSVRNSITEDLALAKEAKKNGIAVLSAAGTSVLSTRMYRSFAEATEGFSKNLYGILPTFPTGFFLVLTAIFSVTLLPFILLFSTGSQGWLVMLMGWNYLVRFLLAVSYKHPIFISTILHPLGIVVLCYLSIRSFRTVRSNRVVWKGRQLLAE